MKLEDRGEDGRKSTKLVRDQGSINLTKDSENSSNAVRSCQNYRNSSGNNRIQRSMLKCKELEGSG